MAAIQFPIADPISDQTPPPRTPKIEPTTTPEVRAPWSRNRIVAVVLGAAVLAAVGLTLLRMDAPATAAPVAATPADVGDFASFATSLYLSQGHEGNEATLLPYFLGQPDFSGVARDQWFVKSIGAVESTAIGEEEWAVLVAVELLGAIGGESSAGYESVGIRHFSLGVARRDGRLIATGLPTPAPNPGAAGSSPIQFAVPDPASPQVVSLAAFLTAYLTGVGDVDVATAAGGIDPLAPAPYVSVSIRRLGVEHSGEGFVAVAEVLAIDDRGRSTVGTHAFLLDDVWRVTAVLPTVPARFGA